MKLSADSLRTLSQSISSTNKPEETLRVFQTAYEKIHNKNGNLKERFSIDEASQFLALVPFFLSYDYKTADETTKKLLNSHKDDLVYFKQISNILNSDNVAPKLFSFFYKDDKELNSKIINVVSANMADTLLLSNAIERLGSFDRKLLLENLASSLRKPLDDLCKTTPTTNKISKTISSDSLGSSNSPINGVTKTASTGTISISGDNSVSNSMSKTISSDSLGSSNSPINGVTKTASTGTMSISGDNSVSNSPATTRSGTPNPAVNAPVPRSISTPDLSKN